MTTVLASGHLLADEVLASVAEELLELKTFEHLLELGAGIGARTTLLAERVATVVAVEEADLSAAALRANLAVLDNADAWHGRDAADGPQAASRRIPIRCRPARYRPVAALSRSCFPCSRVCEFAAAA